MLFNSYPFIFIYLPVVFVSFFLTARYVSCRAATFILVLSSFIFYGYWDYHYVPLLFASITVNYLIGRQISKTEEKKIWLIIGLVVNVALLGYFKYTDFALGTVNDLSGTAFDLPHVILPLGISFFTFTQSAYLVDAYRGEAAKHDFLTYCEFVTIFPHLIAGPIINHKKMLPQFTAAETFRINIENVTLGIILFAMGLAKKVLIADNLAPIANDAFSKADSLTFLEAWIGALSYTFQLYFDFSGYSEMAIGLGLMFNLKLPVNFNSPYQARSIIDFWRRWHMTLGAWVKDYLYIPMGGNRLGELKKMRNLFVSMLIIGLWHGAGWTFVAWGGIHGALLMINHAWRKIGISLPNMLNWSMTFVCVVICWVFFRANNISEAFTILMAMTDVHIINIWATPNLLAAIVKLTILGIILLVFPNPVLILQHVRFNSKRLLLLSGILGLLFAFTLLSIGHIESEFLYFQF